MSEQKSPAEVLRQTANILQTLADNTYHQEVLSPGTIRVIRAHEKMLRKTHPIAEQYEERLTELAELLRTCCPLIELKYGNLSVEANELLRLINEALKNED